MSMPTSSVTRTKVWRVPERQTALRSFVGQFNIRLLLRDGCESQDKGTAMLEQYGRAAEWMGVRDVQAVAVHAVTIFGRSRAGPDGGRVSWLSRTTSQGGA